MLKIRPEQIEVLREYMERQFEDKVINFLRRHFEETQNEPREELRLVVREQIAKARSYELETERQIMIYMVAAWSMGQEFDTQFPEAQEILTSSEYSPDEKSERLAEWDENLSTEQEEKFNEYGKYETDESEETGDSK